MPHITFLPYEIRLDVPRGTSVLAAADEAAEMVDDDFFIGELCEGRHECGNCVVEVVEGADALSPVTDSERRLLDRLGAGAAFRTACTARIHGDATVRIPHPVKHAEASGEARMQAHP
ncbi:MAG: 2Fe-2S iron-sulfur cluster binding domain-containing protein [Planctomycetes bacterium]|nr:2Fe-2S iron-sulfur cluster binding domain-containing protein [Planctomycetota bacterium]